ncbi:MAG: C_GCAxxG_C_C family protein [Pirellulales bacterium]|nr:C_GCAxxG_C_C family protein [Pirellulales bacterium]
MTKCIKSGSYEDRSTRRAIIGLTAAGASLVFVPRIFKKVRGAEECDPSGKEPPFDVDGQKHQIIDAAYRLGHQYEKQYGGCAQCTLAALQDVIPFLAVDKGLFRGASCLDGGATPNGLQNCGSFTGAAMAIGYLCGRQRNGKFEGTTDQSHELIHKLYKQYETLYGSVLCKDVREKANRDCPEVVGLAAKWTAQILLDEFGARNADELDLPPFLGINCRHSL